MPMPRGQLGPCEINPLLLAYEDALRLIFHQPFGGTTTAFNITFKAGILDMWMETKPSCLRMIFKQPYDIGDKWVLDQEPLGPLRLVEGRLLGGGLAPTLAMLAYTTEGRWDRWSLGDDEGDI